MPSQRTKLQQEVVDALLDTRAINLEAVAGVMASFGERALREGDDFATIINGNAIWNCGLPGLALERSQLGQVGQQNG
ncbi:MAG TPA: hypothetical protein VFP89_13865 [Propionibacteriaceae bacterium]|nr:hypothetical protein [Propionibacteriaceae bacterium]